MSTNDRHSRDYDRRRRSRSRSRSRSRDRYSSSHNSQRHRNEDYTRNNERRRSRERDWNSRDRDQDRSRARDDTRHREYENHSRHDRRDNRSYYDRDDDQRHDDRDYKAAEPSKVLILRGLDAYVTEDIIADTFKVYCPVESVRVIKNKTTGESRGFAFITFQSVELAQQVLNTLNGRIDVISQGRTIRGDLEFAFSNPRPESTPHPRTDWICPKCGGHNFSRRIQCYQCKLDKPADATALPQINGQQFWDPNQTQNYWQDPNAAYAAGYDPAQYAAAYGMDPAQYAAYYQQYTAQQPATEATPAPAAQPSQPNTGADLDDEFSSFLEQVGSSDTKSTSQPQQWPPGMNFVWDDSKGCYIDAQSGYCYEAMSGLYFRRLENDKIEYYTYDTTSNTFAPHKEQQVVANPAPKAASVAKTVVSAQPVKVISSQPVISAPPVIEKPPEEKPASTPSAAKPALVSISFSKSNPNDIDKWNQRKQELRAAFEEEEAQNEEKSNSDQNSNSDPAGEQDLDDVSDEPEEEEGPITVGTICMLCQRELQTEAKLQKHLTQSDLHKKNLEAREEQRRQKQQDRLARKLYKQQLQNMKNAKKRKKNWNNKKNKKQKTELNPLTSGPPTAGLGFGGAPVSATPATPALDDDSPAARMMRKMGWKGGGLGAKESGMENPVQVTMRTERTGLGSETEIPVSEDLTILPTDTYQQATRKRMLARFNNLS